MSGTAGKIIAVESAVDWIRGSLARGTGLARIVQRYLSGLTQAQLLAPPSRIQEDEPTLDETGRGIPSSESDEVARLLLSRLGGTSVMTLAVEDDLRRRGDPYVLRHRSDPHVGRAAFIDDYLLHWEQLDDRGERAARLLRHGAYGYPLNAYILKGSPTDNGLTLDKELSDRDIEQLAESIVGVIVSVWDGEAFVALLAPQFRL